MAEAIAQDRKRCQFLFCLVKNPLLCRSAWPESSREARERFLMERLSRTQSERCRRLALADGFRFLRSSEIDRLDALAHAAGRGSAGPDGTRLSSANVSLKRRSPFIHGKIIANLAEGKKVKDSFDGKRFFDSLDFHDEIEDFFLNFEVETSVSR